MTAAMSPWWKYMGHGSSRHQMYSASIIIWYYYVNKYCIVPFKCTSKEVGWKADRLEKKVQEYEAGVWNVVLSTHAYVSVSQMHCQVV